MDLQLALPESKEYQRAIALSKEIVDLSRRNVCERGE